MLPEKPSFGQSCNFLSQYLKEKGSFGDLTLGITCNVETNGTPQVPPTAMNLFPNNIDDLSGLTVGSPRNSRSMDLYPQGAASSVPAPKDGVPERVDCSTVTTMNKFEPQTAQMTIFYGGQVMVFNDFPADKAKEIMLLASKSSSQTNRFNPSRARSPIKSSIGSKAGQPAQLPLPGYVPIARRASLHRFLEKRKYRIMSKAPYQITSSAASPSESGNSSRGWVWLLNHHSNLSRCQGSSFFEAFLKPSMHRFTLLFFPGRASLVLISLFVTRKF